MIALKGNRKPKTEKAEKAPKPLKKEKASKSPKTSSKSLSLNKGSEKKFIFFIGDEGAVLVCLEGKTVSRRMFTPSADVESISAVRQLLETSPKTPIYALIDMIDQSYIKQTLPPVTKLSVQKLIKRRLERDFGPEDITGALPLGRESGGRKDWNYLLISLASSPQLMQWLDFILELDNPFEGLYLVPIESTAFINKLKQEKLGKEASGWQLLVSHNKVGGFRQVVLKNGQLVFTRLAQPIGDTSPEVIAGNVEQEIANTVEYLKRLSFTEDEGLDCFIIVSTEIKKHLEISKIKARNAILLTPYEINELLGLDKAALPEDHYADVVFATFFGLNRKKLLPLQSKYSQQLLKFRKALKAVYVTTAVICLLLGGYGSLELIRIFPQLEEVGLLQTKIASITSLTSAANKKNKALPANIDRMEDLVSLHKIFSPDKEEIINFIRTFRQSSQKEVVVTQFEWKSTGTIEQRFNSLPPAVAAEVEVTFLNSEGSVDEFTVRAKDFFNRMRAAYPQYKMTTSKLPGIIDQEQSFQTQFSGEGEGKKQGMLSGEPIAVTLTFATIKPEEQSPQEF